jgi:hypothetical protein
LAPRQATGTDPDARDQTIEIIVSDEMPMAGPAVVIGGNDHGDLHAAGQRGGVRPPVQPAASLKAVHANRLHPTAGFRRIAVTPAADLIQRAQPQSGYTRQ